MQIRCKIERKGGSTIVMDTKEYRFEPAEQGGHHICNISDKAHIARFLSIPEGYEIVGKQKSAEPDNDEDGDPADEDGDQIETANLSLVLTDPDAATDEQLADAFKSLYGRKPNTKSKREAIIDRIKSKAAEVGVVE